MVWGYLLDTHWVNSSVNKCLFYPFFLRSFHASGQRCCSLYTSAKTGNMQISQFYSSLELPSYCKAAAIPFNIWNKTKQSSRGFKKTPKTKPPQTKPPLPAASCVCISVYTVTFKINKQHRLHRWARSCYKHGVEFHHKLLHSHNRKTPGWWTLNLFWGVFLLFAGRFFLFVCCCVVWGSFVKKLHAVTLFLK